MNHAIFAVILMASLVAFSPIAIAQEAGEKVTRHYDVIKPNLPKTLTNSILGPAGTAVYEIRVDLLTNSVSSVDVSLQAFDPDAAELTNLPGGFVHSYFQISGTKVESSNLESLRIKFSVSDEWIEDNKIIDGSIKLLRLIGNDWVEVDTELIPKPITNNDPVQNYQSELRSISLLESLDPIVESTFAIIGETEEIVVEETDDTVESVQEIPSEPESEVVEIVEVPENEGKDYTLIYIVVGIVVIIGIVVLMFMPGSRILKRKLRR